MANRRYNKPKHVRKFADKMRRRPVAHELMFLRRLTLANIASFDYQVRVGYYIADFVFPNKMLIIELDGPQHDAAYDTRRDAFLAQAGFIVWRIPNGKGGALAAYKDRRLSKTGRGAKLRRCPQVGQPTTRRRNRTP